LNPGLGSSPELQGQGWACFQEQREALFAYPPAYSNSCGRFRLPESRSDVTILVEILTMPALKKEREYLEGKQWR
jgi:hypothetical protein